MSTSSTSSTNPVPSSQPTSTGGSQMPLVERVALETHGRDVEQAVARVRALTERLGVEIVDGDDADIAVVLGGDGTMLHALTRFLGTGVPVIGVNYGHVGFLTTIPEEDLEEGLLRVFRGDSQTIELPTIEVETGGKRIMAVNDAVITSGIIG